MPESSMNTAWVAEMFPAYLIKTLNKRHLVFCLLHIYMLDLRIGPTKRGLSVGCRLEIFRNDRRQLKKRLSVSG